MKGQRLSGVATVGRARSIEMGKFRERILLLVCTGVSTLYRIEYRVVSLTTWYRALSRYNPSPLTALSLRLTRPILVQQREKHNLLDNY